MLFEILDKTLDEVIHSDVFFAKCDYEFAIEYLYPLVDKLDIQRSVLKKGFYKRLEHDILNKCVMPAITLAFMKEDLNAQLQTLSIENITSNIRNSIQKAFILDGIQRLNILNSVKEKPDFPEGQTLYINLLVCNSMNELLYRMITLNNGQKPMSVKHQIEILTQNLLSIDKVKLKINTHKENSVKYDKDAFSQANITLAYLAFLTKSTNIDNQKIIEEAMDDILVNKVIENQVIDSNIEFSDVINEIVHKCCEADEKCFRWFKNENNLIGFSASISDTYDFVKNLEVPQISELLNKFEQAFTAVNISKVKVSGVRRKFSSYIFKNIEDVHEMEADEFKAILLEEILD